MNDIAQVYLYFGEENYKKRIYKDKLKNAVVGGNEINYAYFEGTGIDFGAVYDSVVTMPFFADKRLVIVENSGVFKSRRKKKDQDRKMMKTLKQRTFLIRLPMPPSRRSWTICRRPHAWHSLRTL